MLYLCFSVYNEMPHLWDYMLRSKYCAPHAKVVAVDGRYEAFPGESPWSDDGTVDIIRELADIVIECPNGKPWPNEEVKRSAYFVGQEGDEYLVVDGDEEIVGHVSPDLPTDLDANVELHRDTGQPPYPVFRYHKHDSSLKYHGHHNAIWRGGSHVPRRLCRTWKEGDGTVSFHLLHHTVVRDVDRCKKRGVYYRWLSDRERSFRAIIGE